MQVDFFFSPGSRYLVRMFWGNDRLVLLRHALRADPH